MNGNKVKNSLKIICEDLRRARIRAGWTQQKLSKKIGCAQQTISSFEKGELNNLYIAFFYTAYFDTKMLNGSRGDN